MGSDILAIVGPTASGKTELGLKLAREQNGEIISVDSRQVYQHLLVGTAKPKGTWETNVYRVQGIPYHLVDFLNPKESFSAAAFVLLATEKAADIQARGKTPIFVGGTGLYFKALTEGLAPLPRANPEVRARLKKEAEESGRNMLHQKLMQVDPEAAVKIPANNIQRLVRALEVYEATGKPISVWHQEHQLKPKDRFPLAFLGMDVPRDELNLRIETRCRTMMKEGMIEETESLLRLGYPDTCPALSGLGYPRVVAYLKGTLSKDDCLQLLIQDTRQYAKRQRTWFRHQLPVTWKK